MASLSYPALDPIRTTLTQIAANGGPDWRGRVFVVGGAVRDRLMGLPLKNDFDLLVDGDALALARELHQSGITDHFPVEYANFGTVMLGIHGIPVELVTARKECYRGESRKPVVEPATLFEDAERRDFTINALSEDLFTGEVIDRLGTGLADLEGRVLRTPLAPEATFHEDPLRMLRAVRFVHQLEFSPASGLYEAIASTAPRLKIISAERIQAELNKVLVLPTVSQALEDLRTTGLLAEFWPEFLDGVGMTQGDYHHLDVWGHTRAVVAAARPTLRHRLAALFHDVGKPRTRTVEDTGRIRFFGHDDLGAEMTATMLRRLRYPGDITHEVATLVKHHMRLGGGNEFKPRSARKLLHDLGELADDLIDLCEADSKGLKASLVMPDYDEMRATLEDVRTQLPSRNPESPLTGRQLMDALGLSSGHEIGRLKAMLTEAVIEGRLAATDEAGALALAKEFLRNPTD